MHSWESALPGRFMSRSVLAISRLIHLLIQVIENIKRLQRATGTNLSVIRALNAGTRL